jgi:hypothetical protein
LTDGEFYIENDSANPNRPFIVDLARVHARAAARGPALSTIASWSRKMFGAILPAWIGESFCSHCFFPRVVFSPPICRSPTSWSLADFVCPRSWCYVTDCNFYAYKKTAAVWHEGMSDPDMKFVLRRCRFDGATGFNLGRHFVDAQFYFLDCKFSVKMKGSRSIV